MARTELTIKDCKDTFLNLTDNDTVIDATLVTAGVSVTDFFENVDNSGEIIVSNSSEDTAYDVTIVKGTGVRAGSGTNVGNLVVEVPFGEQVAIPINDSARFMQADGALYINLETGLTGLIIAKGKKRENNA